MKFKIRWTVRALQELDKLEEIISKRLTKIITKLSENPYSKDIKRISKNFIFRARAGNYRIIFEIKKNTMFILKIGRRKNIYKK